MSIINQDLTQTNNIIKNNNRYIELFKNRVEKNHKKIIHEIEDYKNHIDVLILEKSESNKKEFLKVREELLSEYYKNTKDIDEKLHHQKESLQEKVLQGIDEIETNINKEIHKNEKNNTEFEKRLIEKNSQYEKNISKKILINSLISSMNFIILIVLVILKFL